MEAVISQAIFAVVFLVLVITMSRQRDRLIDVLSKPQVDVSQVVRDVLDRFVEQSKSTNETITGVYAPAPTPAPTPADLISLFEQAEPSRMVLTSDFDDTDPTDAYEKPMRSSATMLYGDEDSPFGIPGLITVARKDAPLTVEQILAAG